MKTGFRIVSKRHGSCLKLGTNFGDHCSSKEIGDVFADALGPFASGEHLDGYLVRNFPDPVFSPEHQCDLSFNLRRS